MKISKEQSLSLKISLFLVIFGLAVMYYFPLLRHSTMMSGGYGPGTNKYIFLVMFVFGSYIISYFLAKITLKPLYEANKKLGDYNHNLAHEIKTPIAVIRSNLELLEMKKGNSEYIDSSREEIQKMQEITDTLLFLSEKKILSETEEVSFWELIQEYVGEDIHVQKDKDCVVDGDKKLLRRVIKNLFENAQKYKSENSQIEIKITEKNFSIKNMMRENISPEEREKLTDTFYQADNSRSSEGNGLGLSIVKNIIQMHHLDYEIVIENNIFEFRIMK